MKPQSNDTFMLRKNFRFGFGRKLFTCIRLLSEACVETSSARNFTIQGDASFSESWNKHYSGKSHWRVLSLRCLQRWSRSLPRVGATRSWCALEEQSVPFFVTSPEKCFYHLWLLFLKKVLFHSNSSGSMQLSPSLRTPLPVLPATWPWGSTGQHSPPHGRS